MRWELSIFVVMLGVQIGNRDLDCLKGLIVVAHRNIQASQCSKPTGWLGRFSLWRMNWSHSKLTDWGLRHISIENHYTILDVGCGGGRTVSKLAAIATQGKVYGVDYSDESVAATKRMNAQWMDLGRVEIRLASVSQLPFPDNMFDLVTAVETHFWWPNLAGDMCEVLRVLKPDGTLILIAEIYKGASTIAAKLFEKHAPQIGMTLLSVEEHHNLFTDARYSNVQIVEERHKGWICGAGRKLRANSFHEKAGECQAVSFIFSLFFFLLLHLFFSKLFPWSQAASVATLPSALLVERLSLRASWVYSIQ